MAKKKSLAQIAYEASDLGGKQNWGPWEKAPAIVKEIHIDIAKAVERAVRRRMRKESYHVG